MSDSEKKSSKTSLGLLPFIVIPVVLAVLWIMYYQHTARKIVDEVEGKIEQTENAQKKSSN